MVALNDNLTQGQECGFGSQATSERFVSLCLGGETQSLPAGRCSPARRGELLIAERAADACGNAITFTGPGTDVVLRQDSKSPGRPARASGKTAVLREFTDDDVQSSYGANEIIYCGYPDHGIVIMVIGAGLYDPETRLYYVRNRTYSPTLGRWIQRDPIGYSGGINLYEYVGGRAANKADPNGTQPIVIGAGIGFAVACGASWLADLFSGKSACQITRDCVCNGLSGAILGGSVLVAPEIALLDRCLLGGVAALAGDLCHALWHCPGDSPRNPLADPCTYIGVFLQTTAGCVVGNAAKAGETEAVIAKYILPGLSSLFGLDCQRAGPCL